MLNGNDGARTRGLSRVRRTLIPAELRFHFKEHDYDITSSEIVNENKALYAAYCLPLLRNKRVNPVDATAARTSTIMTSGKTS